MLDRESLRAGIERTLCPKGRLYAGSVSYADGGSDEIDAFALSLEDIAQIGLPQAVEDQIATWHPVLFFRKSREWENEREYRWLLRSPEPAPEFVSIRDSLRGLVLGDNFPDGDLDSVDYLS